MNPIALSVFGLLLCLGGGALGRSVPLPAPYTEHCIVGEKNLYPPNQTAIPWYTIDLDTPPIDRWTQVATAYQAEIAEMIDVIKNLTKPFFHGKLINWVDTHMNSWDNKLPQPYSDEIKGIANAVNLPLGEMVLYNIFYEIFTVCTSIVAQDPTGKLYHARNLDFGLFMGWDPETHDWILTNKLRKSVINLSWVKNGKEVFKTVNFAGFIGVYNGVKAKAFTVTANERFNIQGGYVGIINWLLGIGPTTQWMTWLVRETLEQAANFSQAQEMLSNTPLMSPVYYILGGTKSGEGCIITRSLEKAVNTLCMNLTQPNGWYVLETNYDNWEAPLYLDDRRTPGNECMQKLGQSGVGFSGIFNVLSSKTNLNKLTAYTVLMQVDDDLLETYIQTCPQPCWPF